MLERHASKILVIEDETTQRILAKEYLEAAGYVVRLAEDGKRGLVMAGMLKPDLIILDLLLPSLDGHALCKRLKQHPSTSHIPIILVTASRTENAIEEGLAAGASDFVIKPVDWTYLADRVANVLQQANDISQLTAEKQEREDELRALLEEQQNTSSSFTLPATSAKQLGENIDLISGHAFEECVDAIRRDADEQVRNAITVVQENTRVERELHQQELQRAAKNMEVMSRSFWSVIAATSEPQVTMLTALDQLISRSTTCAEDETSRMYPVTAQQENAVQSLLSSTRNMNALAQHMSGQAELDETPFDLVELVRDAIAHVRSNSDHLKLTVEDEVPNVPIRVVADQERIRYALLSIIMNALKFSPTGGTVRVVLNAEAGEPIQLRVEDTGAGMAPEKIEILRNSSLIPASTLFQPDGRVGFGLPMAFAIMSLHQGALDISSAVGNGTVVTLYLPETRRYENMHTNATGIPRAIAAS